MSRWLGSALVGHRLRVELRPASVWLGRAGVIARRSEPSGRAIEVDTGTANRADAPELWRAAVDVFARALREARGRPGRVEIVLSDHFVRYLLIPWSEGLVGDNERLGFARLTFRDVYGHLADTWDLCLDEQPAGRAFFASAMDRSLVASLREVVARAGGTLAALSPALADRINRHRVALKAPEFCLAAAEPGRISLAFHSRAGWQAVRSRRIDGPLPDTLPTLLKQEAVVGPATGGGVLYLCADHLAEVPPFPVPGWRLVRLADSGFAARPASDLALAAGGGSTATSIQRL